MDASATAKALQHIATQDYSWTDAVPKLRAPVPKLRAPVTPPDFALGDHVTITPLEDCPGRVVALELDHDGWTVVVRYFQNGEAKTLKAFPDEVVRA